MVMHSGVERVDRVDTYCCLAQLNMMTWLSDCTWGIKKDREKQEVELFRFGR